MRMVVKGLFERAMEWLGRHELGTFVLLTVAAVGVWGFAELAEEVRGGRTENVDEMLLLALRNPSDLTDPVGAPWMEEVMRDIAALGGVAVLTILCVTVFTYLLLSKRVRMALLLLPAVGGGTLLSFLMKMLFDRTRPDLVPHGSIVYTKSFPSGHSMLSAVVYLTLAALLARSQKKWTLKAFPLVVAVLIALAVGFSRVYLGVHWPTDVLAGWAAGTSWALLCLVVTRRLQRRGMVEQEGRSPVEPELAPAGPGAGS